MVGVHACSRSRPEGPAVGVLRPQLPPKGGEGDRWAACGSSRELVLPNMTQCAIAGWSQRDKPADSRLTGTRDLKRTRQRDHTLGLTTPRARRVRL